MRTNADALLFQDVGRRAVAGLLLGIGILVLGCSAAWGQTTFGSIMGSVSDPAGAAVPDAQVTLINLGTNEKRVMSTSSAGLYEFVNLIPGSYRIDVERVGFKHFTREPIVVEVQNALRIDTVLQLGALTQRVEVTAQTPLLQPETSDLGQVVDQRKATELPLNGRNPLNLAALVPSVVPLGGALENPTGQNISAYGNYEIGGAMAGQGAIYLDGVPLNNISWNNVTLVPTQDSIQEFKVQTNNLLAEWGRFAGGIINFTTKSGTNAVHGTAYEFLRNKVLNANTFFGNAGGLDRPPFVQNQFGGNAGGPFVIPHLYDGRDKTFWFAGYEGYRRRQGQTFLLTVPTAAERSGDLSNLRDSNGNVIPVYDPTTTRQVEVDSTGAPVYARDQISCNGRLNVICPGAINKAASTMLSLWPAPNLPGQPFTHISNYIANTSVGGNNDQLVLRGDQIVSDKQRIFARFTYWTGLNLPIDPYGTGVCQDRCTENFDTYNGVFGDSYTFSPTTTLDLRLTVNRYIYSRTPVNSNYDLTQLGWPSSLNNEVAFRVEPVPIVQGFDDGGIFASGGAGSAITTHSVDEGIGGTLTKIKGRHTLKFGGDFRWDTFNYIQSNAATGAFSFDNGFSSSDPVNKNGGAGMASFLLGYSSGGSATTPARTAAAVRYTALHFDDTFRITAKLTLNLGLRWQVDGPFSERYDRITWFDGNELNVAQPTPVNTVAGLVPAVPVRGDVELVNSTARSSRNGVNTNWKEFQPRLGFAYRLTSRTVIRGGYGIFFIPNYVEYDSNPSIDFVNSINTNYVSSVDGGLTPCVNPSSTGCVGGPTFNLSNPYPSGIIQPPGRSPGLKELALGQWFWMNSPPNPYGYNQQWNLNVQRELPDGILVDLAYAGSKGTHLPDFAQQIDALPDKYLALGSHMYDTVPNPFYGVITNGTYLSAPTTFLGQLLLPYPQYSGVSINASGFGSSIYHSFQAKVEKRFKGGGSLLAAYTASKLITTGDIDSLISWLDPGGYGGVQNWNNLKGERSLGNFDVPQRLVVSYVLDLPVGRGKRFLSTVGGATDKLVGGWGIEGVSTFQSGLPLNFSLAGGTIGPNDGQRPNKNGSGAISGSPESRLNQWFGTSAFSVPTPYTYGTESRVDSVLRSQGINNFDFALYKTTTFGPDNKLGMQFRAEFFNLFNKPMFGPPATTCCQPDQPNFGVVSSQVNQPRLLQFALRFLF